MKESMQPSAHRQEISAQTEDMACWQSKRESMQPSVHKQESGAQTNVMACLQTMKESMQPSARIPEEMSSDRRHGMLANNEREHAT